jgi:hypothetical protein
MIVRKPRVLLVGVCGLLAALACNCTLGSIIFEQPAAEDYFHPDGMLEANQGMTPDAPSPSSPRDDGENPPQVDQLEGLAPAGTAAGQPSSASQGGGNGSSNAATTGILCDLPQPALQTTLPREARPYLPTGPPFELLRPPRKSA